MMTRLFSLLWYLFASLLIMAAVALSAARLLLPLMGDFRAEIETHIEAVIQRKVTIGRMDAAWRGFGPSLKLQQLQIWAEDGREVIFAVDEVLLQLDLPGSLRSRSLKTGATRLQGLELEVLRNQAGRISLRGFSMPERTVDPLDVLAVVLGTGEIRLVDGRIRWQDDTEVLPALVLEQVDLRLLNRGDRHRIQLSATLPPAYGERMDLVLSAKGQLDVQESWRGKSLLRLKGARLDAWQPWVATLLGSETQLPAMQGRLNLTLWSTFQELALQEVAAEVDLQSLQLHTKNPAQAGEFSLDRLQSRLLWERRPAGGWTLSGDRLQAQQGWRNWPESHFSLQQGVAGDEMQWAGMVDHVNLDMLTGLLQVVPASDAPLLTQLRDLAPGGDLQDVTVHSRLRAGTLETLSLRTAFQQISTHALGKLPALEGVSGRLQGDLQDGELHLDSQDAAVTFANLFRAPLQLSALQGVFHWQRKGTLLRVHSEAFQAHNEDLTLQGNLQLDLPLKLKTEPVIAQPGTDPVGMPSPYLDLYLSVAQGRVSSTSHYLPAGIMNPKAVEWLDHALQGGVLTQGVVLFQGPLRGFPFDQQDGRFEVSAEVEDGVFIYKDTWEPIEDLRAHLSFKGAGMEIQGISGRIGTAQLSQVKVWTPDLRARGPALQVEGVAHGEIKEMLRYLAQSPLGGRYRVLAEQLQPEGAGKLDLAMAIPLRTQHPPFSLQGALALSDNRLQIRESGLELDALQGKIQFTHNSIDSEKLHGRLWEKPVDIQLDTQSGKRGVVHRIRVQGPIDMVAKVKQWQWPVAEYLQGSSDWTMQVKINEATGDQSPRVDLLLDSNLQGVAVDLPLPFTKGAKKSRHLSLSRSLKAGVAGPLRVTYGDDVAAVLQLAPAGNGRQRLERGVLHFGTGTAQLPAKPELLIDGSLQRVSLADWQAVLPKGEGEKAAIPSVGLDLRVAELEIYRRVLRNVGLTITKTGTVWACNFAGPTAQGQVRLEQGEQGISKVDVNLDHLHIETIDGHPGLPQTLKMDPRTLPSLRIRTRHLQYDDRVLGSLELKTRSESRGMQVERLLLSAPDYVFAAEGSWLQSAEGWQSSHFQVQLKNGNLGNLLAALGHERSLETTDANATLQANWPGSPLEFDLESVEGTLAVNLGNGTLPKVDAAAGRALNILSIHTLQRRLSLDFSDLFGKGFSFDHLVGEVSFDGGNAYTSGLSIVGPAATIDISGRTGFVDRDYDQLVTVTPLVSSNLPLAGALAGGPVVGAALFVAEKLFGESMNRLARYQYQVTGSWDDPKLKRFTLKDKTAAPAAEGVQ